jgi:hypothetical protein
MANVVYVAVILVSLVFAMMSLTSLRSERK